MVLCDWEVMELSKWEQCEGNAAMDAGKGSAYEWKYSYADSKEEEGLSRRPDIYDIERLLFDRALCSDPLPYLVCVLCVFDLQFLPGVPSGIPVVAP